MVSANVPWVSSRARSGCTQCIGRVVGEVRVDSSLSSKWLAPQTRKAHVAQAHHTGRSAARSRRWRRRSGSRAGGRRRYSSITPWCSPSLSVCAHLPCRARRVVHEAGSPCGPFDFGPGTGGRAPKGSRLSVAHSLGTWMPASMAARMRRCPGHGDRRASISRRDEVGRGAGGVPWSMSVCWLRSACTGH